MHRLLEIPQADYRSKKRQLRPLRKQLPDPGRNSANFPGTGEETRGHAPLSDYLTPQEPVQSGRKRVKNKHVEITGTFVFIGRHPRNGGPSAPGIGVPWTPPAGGRARKARGWHER